MSSIFKNLTIGLQKKRQQVVAKDGTGKYKTMKETKEGIIYVKKAFTVRSSKMKKNLTLVNYIKSIKLYQLFSEHKINFIKKKLMII